MAENSGGPVIRPDEDWLPSPPVLDIDPAAGPCGWVRGE